MGTTISVSDDTWERLDDRKERGESFDDIVSELLDVTERKAQIEES